VAVSSLAATEFGKSLRRWGVGVCLAAPLLGCQREDIRVYQVPKEKPQKEAAAHAQARRPKPRVEYRLPEGWQEKGPEAISIASFLIRGQDGQTADVGIVPFPGLLGNDALALNIWRERVKLPPLSEDELGSQAETVPIGAETGRLFDMVSPEPLLEEKYRVRLLLALLNHDGTSWFFKMSGEDALVLAQRPVFLEFLKSISIQEAAPIATAGPPPRFSANEPQSPDASGANRRPSWQVPPEWKEEAPTDMVLAKFLVPGQSGSKADVTVVVLPGESGGLVANVNRWRRQVGLAPIDQSECDKLVSSLDLPGGKAMLVDMTGKDASGQPARLIAVVVPRGEDTWFYKMLGDAQVAEQARPAFMRFVQSAQYAQATP
jgi:hypothetical protein